MNSATCTSQCFALKGITFLPLIAVAVGCGLSKPSAQVDKERIDRTSSIQSERQTSRIPDEVDVVARATVLLDQGENASAEELLKSHLVLFPQDAPALFLFARCQARRNDLATAIETLELISPEHPQAGLAALGQAADWLIRLQKYPEAESKLRSLIARKPELVIAQRRLAMLLNMQGRRAEAIGPMRALAQLGVATEPELYGMTHFSDPFIHRDEHFDFEMQPSVLCTARLKWFDGSIQETLVAIEQALKQRNASLAAWAFYGKVLAAVQADDKFQLWQGMLPAGIEDEPEYWHAVALFNQRSGNHDVAIRCYLEAVERDDTDWAAYLGLARSLTIRGQSNLAEQAERRSESLRTVAFIASELEPTVDQHRQLIRQLIELGRIDEARNWGAITGLTDMASDVTERITISRTCGIEKSQWPLPAIASPTTPQPGDPTLADRGQLPTDMNGGTSKPAIHLVNVASDVNLNFQYQGAGGRELESLKMYQVTGAGVTAFDFDRDGWTDLYFGQGEASSTTTHAAGANELYRNLSGRSFRTVARLAGADDEGYAQGVSHTDLNQDGFTDLLVANIGSIAVLINNGDGTFRKLFIACEHAYSWANSVAAADMDGDHFAEIIVAIYMDDPKITDITCLAASGASCSPQGFQQAKPMIFKWLQSGEWAPLSSEQFDPAPSYGMGLLVGNLDEQVGNEIFVTNDTVANSMFVSSVIDSNIESRKLVDQAHLRGCAVGLRGEPGGSMGIAAGDFDGNHRLDLHVTNFADEPCDLFLQSDDGIFTNGLVRYGLDQLSLQPVGWGTQATDLDGDGWLDLIVLNGHLYADSPNGASFQMLPQCMAGGPAGFELPSLSDSYWQRPALGRALIKCDWNRDGRNDLVATHLDQPAALLENHSIETHWIQLELVGVISERDAVGTSIKVQTNQRLLCDWVTTGDGYQCRNESIASLKLQPNEKVASVHIAWPSGRVESYDQLEVNHRNLLIEGQQSFSLD